MRLIRNNVERIAATEEQAEALKKKGFQALGEAAGTKEEAGEKTVDEKDSLEKLSAQELKALAREKGIEGAAGLTKEELLAVLKEVV